ncbi:hypothetical protein TRFO_38331 [Tritrichomonas foetus]|uniref:Uncharacterized protein n=1 Tax=Tritrichomonas foetus TaxID=1144522 RepID=A0A1J4JCY0_9EUKA|nr:hypothetical protein TRFO_38331 [Tritrichomonas foetus]|eukprot:OHS95523.1 hypothetical protein TRFO_38331 [Tritrichomonas foetus]
MTNRVCIVPIGNPAPAQDIVMALSQNGEVKIKNKYFEATLAFDFEVTGKPPAVLWISHSSHVDIHPPPEGQFQDAELRLLLRIVDSSSNAEIPEKLKDWEVDNFAEIINVNLDTFKEEVRLFKEGNKRSSLLDEELQPAGCRVLESLEMVNWPIKATVGKSRIQQKIEKLEQMLANDDQNLDSFDHAMALMIELKGEIPNLPDEEKHKYAAEVAMIFQKILGGGEDDDDENDNEENEDDDEENERGPPEGYGKLPSEDEDEK